MFSLVAAWRSCDDSMVTSIPESRLVSPSAYVLFYQRRAPASAVWPRPVTPAPAETITAPSTSILTDSNTTATQVTSEIFTLSAAANDSDLVTQHTLLRNVPMEDEPLNEQTDDESLIKQMDDEPRNEQTDDEPALADPLQLTVAAEWTAEDSGHALDLPYTDMDTVD